MRFVPAKTPEQQSCLMLHRTRHLFIRQQAAVINAVRTHLAEFGIVAPVDKHDTSGGAQRFLCDVPITRPRSGATRYALLTEAQQKIEIEKLNKTVDWFLSVGASDCNN
jgi:transposase